MHLWSLSILPLICLYVASICLYYAFGLLSSDLIVTLVYCNVSLGIEAGGIVFPSENNNFILYSFSILQTMWELEIFSSVLVQL